MSDEFQNDLVNVPFGVSILLAKGSEERVHGEAVRFVSGFASLEERDQQGETVIAKGIDYKPFLDAGYINWDHGDIRRGTAGYLIGEPTLAEIREQNGVQGFYIEGFLYKGKPAADEAWEHLMATSKSGMSRRKVGWSIQGATTAQLGGKILRSVVRHVAMTHQPVNDKTFVDFAEIAKSLDTEGNFSLALLEKAMGSQVVVGGSSDGTAATLLREDLFGVRRMDKAPKQSKDMARDVITSIYGHNLSHEAFDDNGRFKNGAQGALNHMVTNLGWDAEDALDVVRTLRTAFSD